MDYVFVVGVPRSGTTLIAKYLCQFENACYLPRSIRTLDRFGKKTSFMLPLARPMAILSGKIKTRLLSWHAHDGGDLIWRCFEKASTPLQKQRLIERYTYCRSGTDDQVFVNKRIANVNILHEIAHTFEGATLIHVKRDPIDTVASLLNRRQNVFGTTHKRWGVFPDTMPKSDSDPVKDCAMQYMKIFEKIEEEKELFSKNMDIHYKVFCANPKRELVMLQEEIGLKGAITGLESISLRRNKFNNEIRLAVKDLFSTSGSSELRHYAQRLDF